MNTNTKIFYRDIITVRNKSYSDFNSSRMKFHIKLNDDSFDKFCIEDNTLYFHYSKLKLYPEIATRKNFPAKNIEYYATLKEEEYNRVWEFILNNKPKWMTNETFSQLILQYGINVG